MENKPNPDNSKGLHTYQYGEEEAFLERVIFSFRPVLLVAFFIATVFFAYQITGLRPDASFEKMIPMEHPYIQSFMKHMSDLGAAGTTIQVAVEHTRGDIFDPEYLDLLQNINDEVFYLEGVDRNRMRSLWTPNVRWTEVTEMGFEGDKVIDSNYDGSDRAMAQLRQNILRSGEVGRLVADDYRSSIVQAPLIDIDPASGQPLDYMELSRQLEENVRDKYEQMSVQADGEPIVKIRIIGFAKIIGDLIDGFTAILLFAVITLVITSVLLFLYTRSLRGTLSPLFCSIIAVIWQLGLLTTLGYGLNPYSILIPFLVFAIGVSHGVQLVNAFLGESIAGHDRQRSARRAFRALYIPGMTALVSDAIGFTTMLLIPIQVIKDLGIAASVGVAVVVLTNLVLLPIMMSYIGITRKTLEHHRAGRTSDTKRVAAWQFLSNLASRRVAVISIAIGALGFALGIYGGQNLKIGDLDPGAPELRPDSRYNLDNQYITENYATSSDVLVVMVETRPEECAQFNNLELVDRFSWHMQNVPGVSSAMSAAEVSKLFAAGYNEGNLKWATINRDQRLLGSTFDQMPGALMNTRCSLLPVALFLDDHKADTLQRVVDAAQDFADQNRREGIHFALAAGNAGIEAATNQEIATAQTRMMTLIYSVVGALVFLSFASWRAVICIMVPLALTSVLAQALMAYLGIGVKVATLPVIALGVGVGVDYGIYIYSKLTFYLRRGMDIQTAYYNTLITTGEAVSLTGVMLAVGVATWIWSPIKFQADMGLLLTFMFLWNMVGALWLLPALAHFLLNPEKWQPRNKKPHQESFQQPEDNNMKTVSDSKRSAGSPVTRQLPTRVNLLSRCLTVAALTAFTSTSYALSFEFGDGDEWLLDWDTNVGYTAQWRVADRDDKQFRYRDTGDLIADSEAWSELINGDDGDNNFDQGAMVQNKVNMVTEMDLSYRNFGLFARARAYYDDVYDGNTDMDRDAYLTYNNNKAFPGGDANRGEFPDGTVDEHRDRVEMLDYFLYAGGELGDGHLFDIRLGSQVINWGEATFTPGINGLQSRADLIARNTPGVEVKEILLPSGALYGQIDVIENLTFEAYYQYEWKETELNGVGSFFSDRDFLGPGAKNFLIGVGGDRDNLEVVTRGPDKDASDSGQWGAAFHWIVFGDTDLGFYYVNAHNKAPAYQVLCGGKVCGDLELPDTYTIRYFEDIQGYAASFTTVLANTNVQGEVAFKTDMPVVDLRGNPIEGDVASYQIGGSYVFQPNALWDDANLTFELAGAYVTSEDSSDLRFEDHGTVVNLRFEPSYLNIVPGWDLKVPIFFKRGLDGVILESEMVEDASAVNIEFQFVYLTNFIIKAGYTNFWDGGEYTTINDRDNVSLNVSYSF